MSNGVTASHMVEAIIGQGVNYSNVSYTGSSESAGIFSNGGQAGLNLDSGIILSCGSAAGAVGPNNSSGYSVNTNYPGDTQLSALINGSATWDASILEFDFIPQSQNIQFNFILGSEEYPEYLNFHDVFGFFLDGVNIALLPGTTTPISIATVNHLTNSQYYISNSPAAYDIQCDGFTVSLQITGTVVPNQTHHIKLAVADMGDHNYDTWIFLEQNSFISGADVSITMSAPPVFNPNGSNTYEFILANQGPTTAQNINAQVRVPYSFGSYSTVAGVGNVQANENIITWSVSDLTPGSQTTLQVNATGLSFESLNFAGSVYSSVFDPIIGNNIFPQYQNPAANVDLYFTDEDVQLIVPDQQGVLTNDFSYVSTQSNCIVSDPPDHASSFSLTPYGGFTYTPVPNYFGLDSFTYYFNDGSSGTSNQAIVTITVNAVNDPPTIDLPATFSFVKGDPLTINVTPYISDVDNTELTISAVSSEHIQVTVDAQLVTLSCIDWTGTENVSISVSDGVDRVIAMDIITVTVLAPHSCYDIQYTLNSNGLSPYNGTKVTVEGVVTGTGYTGGKFFIGDSGGGVWSGLQINSSQTVSLGDRVLLTGYVQETGSFTALGQLTGTYILSSGNTLPASTLLNTAAVSEAYESVLCRLENVIVNTLPNTSQIFTVMDAAGTTLIDDGFYSVGHTWNNIAYGQMWQSITGIVDYHTSAYHINPRTDSEMIYSAAKTCYEVQYSTLTDYVSPLLGQVVQVNAVVTAANLARGLYWLGDPLGGAWSGLMVHDWNHPVTVGDNVLVTGLVTEYEGQTELDQISNVIILSNGNALPAPTLLLPGNIVGLLAEQYEGVLIKVEQVSVSQVPDINQEFIVSGQSGSVRIDDRLYPLQHTWQNMDLSRDWRSITGILDYMNASFRIIPRSDAEMQELREYIVAVNTNERHIQIVDTADNTVFGPYLAGQLGTNSLIGSALVPVNNRLLLSSFEDFMVYQIDMNNPFNPTIQASYNIGFAPEDIAYSQDGRFALVADGGTSTMVAVLDLESRTTDNTIDISPLMAQGIAIGPDGKVLLNEYANGIVHQYLLDLNTGALSYSGISMTGCTSLINITIHPNGKTAFLNQSGVQCKSIKLNPDNTITELQQFTEFTGSTSAIYSADGSKLFILSTYYSPDRVYEYDVESDGTLTYHNYFEIAADCTGGYYGIDAITCNLDGSWVYAANNGTATTGIFTCINTISNEITSVQAVSPTSLDIGNLPLSAFFDPGTTSVATQVPVHFTQYSTGAPQTFLWNFGDGTTSTQRHPQHSYATAGTYSVSLTVTNGSRTSTITKANLISVQSSPNLVLSTSNISASILGEGIAQNSFTITNTGDVAAQFQISDMSRNGLQPRIVDCTVRSKTPPENNARGSNRFDRADDYSTWLSSNRSQTREVDWLSEAPSSGTILPGESVEIVVTFNSTGLVEGIYNANIEISSNDVFNPAQYINATLAVSVANFTSIDNENNAQEGVPDFDMDVYIADTDANHPVEFNIFVTETDITDAQLSILAWDVDETSGELDHVYINGNFAGALTGADEQWSTTVFVLDPAWVIPGPMGVNRVQIRVNESHETWMTTIDWGQLILNQQTHHATIRNITLADSIFSPGMNIGITQEIDTDLATQVIRIETNILDPDGINVAGASEVYTIHGNADDAVSIQRAIPADIAYGTYQVQTIVYNNVSNIQQDICWTEFLVIQPDPVLSYDPASLDFVTVMVTDSLMLEIDFYNGGYNNLNISQFSIPNAAFRLSSNNVVIPHHETRTLQITYVPTGTANYDGALTITSNNSTGSTVTIPITAQSILYPVPMTSIVAPEQVDHPLLNVWQIVAEVTFSDAMIVDASTLQYRYDRNGNGVYDPADVWTAISGYSNSSVINVQQVITWRLDGEHLCFEFRAQNLRRSGWSYTGTAQTMGIADDYYVRLDATPPQWIESLEVTTSGGNSVTLAWSPSADNHFASYEIYYGTSEGITEQDLKWDNAQDPELANPGTTATTITGLSPGTTYYFAIRGRDSVANAGDFSDEVSAITGQGNNVQNLHLEHSQSGIVLSWSALASASQYKIYHAESPGGPWQLWVTTPNLSIPITSGLNRQFFYVTGDVAPAKSGHSGSKN
jgi:PKD repeat protein